MDGEQHHYELRSRSRSRSHTPAIFNQMLTENEPSDHHYELRSRESRERSHTPGEVSSSRRSGSKSLPGSATKSKDKSMETITENHDESDSEQTHQITLESEASTPSIMKKTERRSERQRIKRQLLTNGQGEARERKSVDKTETKSRKSVTPKRTITSDYSSEEGEREDPPSRPASAYEIYKQAGDYWNVFPKTDYTYSPASQCRYEIAPGILAMPNMSRPSIHSDGSSHGSSLSLNQQTVSRASGSTREGNIDSLESEYNESIEQNRLNEENARIQSAMMRTTASTLLGYKQVHVEQYSRHSIFYADRGQYGDLTQVDSDTEYDEAAKTKTTINRAESRWRMRRFYESVKSVISFLLISVVDIVNSKILRRRQTRFNASQGYYRYEESKWKKMWSFLDHYLQYLYLWLIKILCLDTWILSRFSRIRRRIFPHKSRLFWLLLLPPLLLTGFWFIPRAYNLTLPNFTTDSSEKITKTETPLPADITKRANNNFLNEEFRKSIEILINRVESLEASALNQNKHFANMTEYVEGLGSTQAWEQYDKKLSTLELKLTDHNNNNKDEKIQEELATIKLEFSHLKEFYKDRKSYCENIPSSVDVQSQVEQVMASYFLTGAFKSEITKIVEEIIKSNTLIAQKSEKMDVTSEKSNCRQSSEVISFTDDDVRMIVRDILKIYDADKTGRVDYALESAGGQVISIRCTQKYNVNTRAFKVLGFTLFYESGDPRTVIQGHPLQPGLCWAFQDFPGYLVIKLRSSIKVSGFTLEHAPRSILPNNEMKSAPRKFNVWGLKEENDVNPVLFGEYEFKDTDESLQYFPVENQEIDDSFDLVELRIHSNHGQLEYTCLYRFRIHGVPV